MADCITKLTQARDALHALLTGEQVVSFSIAGTTTSYSAGNIDALRRYVRELEAECGETDSSGKVIGRRGAVYFRG